MSGNFDYPPASTEDGSATNQQNLPPRFPSTTSSTSMTAPATANPTLPNVNGRLQQLQNILRAERERARQAVPDTSAPMTFPLPAPSGLPSDSRRRRAIIRNIAAIRASRRNTASPPFESTVLPRPASVARPRATPSERYLLQRSRHTENRPSDPLSDLQQAGARLAEASSDLRSLLDDPVRVSSPDLTAREFSGEAEVNRTFKRRRLDAGGHATGPSRISYGHYGQVEPGQLKMEIVSCDGGNYPDAEGKDRAYWAENVLRNDKSVYCTKIGQCNLLLRHQGDAAFCLRRLVIKAPRSGFTAPVQEGMVFVSMTSDDVLARTATYHMEYPEHTAEAAEEAGEEASRPRASPFPRPPYRRQPWLARHGTPREQEWMRQLGLAEAVEASENCDEVPTGEAGDAADHQPFSVTTDYGDEEDENDEEDESTPEVQAVTARRRRELMAMALSENEDGSDSSDRGASVGIDVYRDDLIDLRPLPMPKPPTRLTSPNLITLNATVTTRPDEVVDDALPPHARFFIKKDKSRCSIVFDPPVSGRFLLLKLWSPALDENIDIQSVVAWGFAGTRFFPARELR
ncbi:MAG: hypothetical protein M1832_004715 [Thelocarpon impressellum]|nr:MAG: hypothetical protein M1832_004715 [Thelocarpon impressellum]